MKKNITTFLYMCNKCHIVFFYFVLSGWRYSFRQEISGIHGVGVFYYIIEITNES